MVKAITKTDKFIPFVDLKQQYESIKEEVNQAIQRVIENASFTLGEEVELFEEEFANFCGVKYAAGVSSGTDALHLALLACEVGEEDEVITVPNTFIATTEAISVCGAKPVFVDIDEKTYNIDVTQIEQKITEKTKAIVPVHLYGQPAEMEIILNIAKKYRLKVVEDACQAHGATYRGKKVGSLGDAACFSFYPSKNLGAFGDGGMVVTDDQEIAKKIRLLRNHGQQDKYTHAIEGFCKRLHGLQAAVLRVKLRYLPRWNASRQQNAQAYNKALEKTAAITPLVTDNVEHVYHLYVVRAKERNELRQRLAEKGISSGIHYPVPLHLQPAYARLGYGPGSFPVTERVTSEIVSLPMFPELGRQNIEEIAHEVRRHTDLCN